VVSLVFDTGITDLALALEGGLIFDTLVDFDDLGLSFLASPITAFFTALLFAVVFFLVGADFLLVVAFFAVSFLTGAFVPAGLTFFAFVVVARALRLGAARVVTLPVGFFVGALVAVALALVVTVFRTGFLEWGIVFSLAVSERDLGASLTLPEGPLGRRKIPFSLPELIARLS